MIFAIAISLKSGRKQRWQFGAVAILVLGMSSCGGGSKTVTTPVLPPTPANTNATIVVTGTSGTSVSTVNLSLTITH
jgi:hypothetical protein